MLVVVGGGGGGDDENVSCTEIEQEIRHQHTSSFRLALSLSLNVCVGLEPFTPVIETSQHHSFRKFFIYIFKINGVN